ncbi:hypothetical protein ABPG72_000489 [Tetrahymena utriculariae]
MDKNYIYEKQKVKGQSFTGTAKIIIQYLINDIKKKPRSFKIGIFSIFLVIGFISAIESAFQLSPVIFLTIGEDQAGDADIVLTPVTFQNRTFFEKNKLIEHNQNNQSAFSSMRLINSSLINDICENIEGIQGCSPRWLLLADLYNSNPETTNHQKFRSYVITIDSVQERSIGVGRRFKGDILNKGEAYVTAPTMRGLNLKEGEKITVNIDMVEAILKNESLFELKLKNQTTEAIYEAFSEQFRKFLLESFPNLMENEEQEVNLNKQQILNIMNTLNKYMDSMQTETNRQAIYFALQMYMEQQGISNKDLNIVNNLEPLFQDGSIKKIVDDFNNASNNLPEDFHLNVTEFSQQITPLIMKAVNFTQDFKVIYSVDSTKGKWASILGNTIVIDSNYILQSAWLSISQTIKNQLDNPDLVSKNPSLSFIKIFYNQFNLSNTIYKRLENLDLNQYAMSSNVIFKDRMHMYTGKSQIQQSIVKLTDKFAKETNDIHPVQSAAPLSIVVSGLLILKMFLDNMIATSIFLLFMLAVLLIYSLMISDVEEKTYEFGMLRALGFKKVSLVYLLIAEGLIFAFPGLGLGLLMAYLVNSIIAFVIFNRSMVVTSYDLHWSAVVLAVCLGIFIPLLSVYLPIQRAMSKTLRDSLDLYHRVINEISVSVQKLERLGISFSQFVNSITLIVTGVVCYYFAPAAFVYQDLALFLAIINIVLILMIIGFTLLLNLTQPFVERIYIKLFLCFFKSSKHLESIITKNMEGHRRRNGKTALMYTVALSFLIFAGTGFKLQSKSIVDNLKSSLGSDLKVSLLRDRRGLDEFGMRQFLDSYMKEFPDHIQAYSFITLPINLFPQLSKPKFSSLSQFPTNRNLELRGIEKNYLSSTYLDFYYPEEFDPKMNFPYLEHDQSVIDAVYGLYTDDGITKLQNSVDFYKVGSNSDIRDQNLMGGGQGNQSEQQEDPNEPLIGQDDNSPINQISRHKFEDKEVKLIIPSGLHYISSVDVNTPCLLNFEGIKYRCRIRNTSRKFPGFRFSSYRQISFYGEILTSTEQLKYLVDTYYYYSGDEDDERVKDFFSKVMPNSTYNIPKTSLNIQFKKSLSQKQREVIGNGLRNYFKSDFTSLFDVNTIIEQVQETLFFIDLFSIVIASISIVLSFFLILVSFVANIKENSWEFGVLRAIGLNKVQITRVYMIESCSLVLASGTIGTIIGLVVAVTLTLQVLMFTELPFRFVFPYEMFLTTFFFGLFIAAAASYTALSEFKDKAISSIVKGLI